VDDLVPLHGPADVLDVVQALKVGTRNAGIGVVEAGGDHQPVPADVALPLHGDLTAGEVEARHLPLVVDVDAGLDVGLLAGQEQPVEVGDLLAVDIGDPAGAVGAVLVLGVDEDFAGRVGGLGRPGSADASGATPDNDRPGNGFRRHGPPLGDHFRP